MRRKKNKRRGRNDPILMVKARMVEHKKERVHRTGTIVLVLIVLVVVFTMVNMGALYSGRRLFSENDQFLISNLDIKSDGWLPATHIQEYGGIRDGDNLFNVDITDIQKKLEKVPMIKSAFVQRVLPGTLIVRVTQRVPLARVGGDPRRPYYHLAVDGEGHVLGPSARSRHLADITGYPLPGLTPGKTIREPSFLDALTVLYLCDSTRLNERIRIKSIDVGQPDHLLILLEQGAKVYLSRRDIKMKLIKLDEILRESTRRGQIVATIDMTVEKNFPIEFR